MMALKLDFDTKVFEARFHDWVIIYTDTNK